MEGQKRASDTQESGRIFGQKTTCLGEPDFHEFFEHAPEGILIADAETGAILDANQTFVFLSGHSRETLLNRKFWEIDALRDIDATHVMLRVAQGVDRIFYGDLSIKTKEGKRIHAELMCSVHLLGSGKAIQISIRDVTERKRSEQSRLRSGDQFRRLFDENPQPMWIYERDSLAFLAVNDATIQLFGYSREEFMAMTMRDLLIPAEVPDFLDSIGNVQSPLLKPDVWQQRRKKGDLIDVEIASNEHLFNGRKARFVVATDVTTRKQAEQLLRESRRLLQEMLNALPIGVMITENTGNIIIKNPAMKQVWGGEHEVGVDRYDAYKGRWADSGKPIEAKECAAARALLEGKTTLDEMIDIEDFNGINKTILYSAVPLRDSGGNVAGAIVVNQDITERRHQEEELKRVHALLERQATTDTLTGIFNRLKFNELLDFEIRSALRYIHPLSLIMFDIDHFKSINDTYGHPVGDAVLREIAGLVNGNIRNVDLFARWGGEEFVILSPDTTLSAVRQLAEKLRQLIEVSSFSSPCRVTVSFGLAEFQENDVAGSFIKRADAALYLAKNLGRNRVEPC